MVACSNNTSQTPDDMWDEEAWREQVKNELSTIENSDYYFSEITSYKKEDKNVLVLALKLKNQAHYLQELNIMNKDGSALSDVNYEIYEGLQCQTNDFHKNEYSFETDKDHRYKIIILESEKDISVNSFSFTMIAPPIGEKSINETPITINSEKSEFLKTTTFVHGSSFFEIDGKLFMMSGIGKTSGTAGKNIAFCATTIIPLFELTEDFNIQADYSLVNSADGKDYLIPENHKIYSDIMITKDKNVKIIVGIESLSGEISTELKDVLSTLSPSIKLKNDKNGYPRGWPFSFYHGFFIFLFTN